MCRVHSSNVLLLRGAVFYISMSLWGVKRVEILKLPFMSILPAIHQVLSLPLPFVIPEAQSLYACVTAGGPGWPHYSGV